MTPPRMKKLDTAKQRKQAAQYGLTVAQVATVGQHATENVQAAEFSSLADSLVAYLLSTTDLIIARIPTFISLDNLGHALPRAASSEWASSVPGV